MVSVNYANAMAETLHYLKGVREEDLNKIPKKFMQFLEENAAKDYECNFDYTKPLKDLDLKIETKGIIGAICLNYWCTTEEQKKMVMNKLQMNEDKYQAELREKYNPDILFNDAKKTNVNEDVESQEQYKAVPNEMAMEPVEKQSFFSKLFSKIKGLFKKENNK